MPPYIPAQQCASGKEALLSSISVVPSGLSPAAMDDSSFWPRNDLPFFRSAPPAADLCASFALRLSNIACRTSTLLLPGLSELSSSERAGVECAGSTTTFSAGAFAAVFFLRSFMVLFGSSLSSPALLTSGDGDMEGDCLGVASPGSLAPAFWLFRPDAEAADLPLAIGVVASLAAPSEPCTSGSGSSGSALPADLRRPMAPAFFFALAALLLGVPMSDSPPLAGSATVPAGVASPTLGAFSLKPVVFSVSSLPFFFLEEALEAGLAAGSSTSKSLALPPSPTGNLRVFASTTGSLAPPSGGSQLAAAMWCAWPGVAEARPVGLTPTGCRVMWKVAWAVNFCLPLGSFDGSAACASFSLL
mmetsp:Transcript_55969/g.162240  ORF Transcript_55969/g.162240 Transcript_55969/m.162240 type:complete len:360 (-) Transcript_55969:20-1099(-)